MKDLTQIQESAFDFHFFIPESDLENASIDTILDEDLAKFANIRPPLFEDLLHKDQIYINGSKRVTFRNVNSLFEDFKNINISKYSDELPVNTRGRTYHAADTRENHNSSVGPNTSQSQNSSNGGYSNQGAGSAGLRGRGWLISQPRRG